MNFPGGKYNAGLPQRLRPGRHMLVDRVNESAIQVEQNAGKTHALVLRGAGCVEIARLSSVGQESVSLGFLLWHLGAFLASLRQTYRNRLFAALHLASLAAGAGFQSSTLFSSHCARNRLAGALAVSSAT